MNITQIDGSIILPAASKTTSHELQKLSYESTLAHRLPSAAFFLLGIIKNTDIKALDSGGMISSLGRE